MTLKILRSVLEENADVLLERILILAEKHGFTQHAPSLPSAWQKTISITTDVLCKAIEENSRPISADKRSDSDPISIYAKMQAKMHRDCGVEIHHFFGLLKYYKDTYAGLVDEHFPENGELRRAVEEFFDSFEVETASEWFALSNLERSLKAKTKQMADDKFQLLALLDGLGSAVIQYAPDGTPLLANAAALTFFGHIALDFNTPSANTEAVSTQIAQEFDWLETEIRQFSKTDLAFKSLTKIIEYENKSTALQATLTKMPVLADKTPDIAAIVTDITKQHETESQIAQERKKALSYLNMAGGFLIALDKECRVDTINRRGCEILGYSEAEILGKNWIELAIPPELKSTFSSLFFGIIGGDADKFMPVAAHEILTKNGSRRTIQWENTLLRDDKGEPSGTLSAGTDITENLLAEKALQDSEEKFRRIFTSMEEGFMAVSLGGDITMANPAAATILGYTPNEMLTLNMERDIYAHPEDRKQLVSELRALGRVRSYPLRFRKSDGTIIIAECNTHFIYHDDGSVAGVEGTFQEVTERIREKEKLEKSERHYRSFFQNNHTIMLLVEPKTGRIFDANPAALEFYGYSHKQILAMNISQINMLEPQQIFEEMAKAREENRTYFIFKHRLACGSIRDVEVHTGPITMQGETYLYSVIHDITERRQLELELQRMATTDALTNIANRRHFMEKARLEVVRAKRYKTPLSFLMLDIDHFKSINDAYGHHCGDKVLRKMAESCSASLRESDVLGRMGGEEFAAFLPETDIRAAMRVAERIRSSLENLTVSADNHKIRFTVSIGVSTLNDENDTLHELLKRADKALYSCKVSGRNSIAEG